MSEDGGWFSDRALSSFRNFKVLRPVTQIGKKLWSCACHPCLGTQRADLVIKRGTATCIQMRSHLVKKDDRRRSEIRDQCAGVRQDKRNEKRFLFAGRAVRCRDTFRGKNTVKVGAMWPDEGAASSKIAEAAFFKGQTKVARGLWHLSFCLDQIEFRSRKLCAGLILRAGYSFQGVYPIGMDGGT